LTHKIVGLDAGRGSVVCCAIDSPISKLKLYARTYKPQIFKANYADLSKLLELGEIFAIEPTGADHRVFCEWLRRHDRRVLLVRGDRIRAHATNHGLLNKTDREDAAAIADYTARALTSPDDYPAAFIDPPSLAIGELVDAIASNNKLLTATYCQLWARLAFEFPERLASKPSARGWQREPPTFWAWLAGESVQSHLQRRFDDAIAQSIGRGLSEATRDLARSLVILERSCLKLENQIDGLFSKIPSWYHTVFDLWAIAPRTRSALLAEIYPFDKFLGTDGYPIRDRVAANNKSGRSYRDRSLKKFQLQLGLGQVISQSGTSKGKKVMGGSQQARRAIYLWVKSSVFIGRDRGYPAGSFVELAKSLAGDRPWENTDHCAAIAERNHTTERVASLQIYAVRSPTCQNAHGDLVALKIASRFARLLFKDLLRLKD
jgi:hypothetical protein